MSAVEIDSVNMKDSKHLVRGKMGNSVGGAGNTEQKWGEKRETCMKRDALPNLVPSPLTLSYPHSLCFRMTSMTTSKCWQTDSIRENRTEIEPGTMVRKEGNEENRGTVCTYDKHVLEGN